MFGRVADDRDDHDRDEELREPGGLREAVERVDEDLARDGGRGRCERERDERTPKRPGAGAFRVTGCGVCLPEAAKLDRLHDDVEDEQDSCKRSGQDGERVSLGVAVPARHRRGQEHQHRRRDEPELQEERVSVDWLARLAGRHRDAEHEQQVRDDAAGERAANDVGQPVRYREEGDDQFRGVAEARVQEAADPGAGVLGSLLGRFSDQPGQRDERSRGEHEQRDVSRMEGEVDDERDRGERERRPEELPRHADTLTACRRRSSSIGATP